MYILINLFYLDDLNNNLTKRANLNTQNQQKLIVNAQSAFQCSSTPLTLHVRYMVWNSVGLITQSNIKGSESINIEFHNATFHHTIDLKNQFGYTMADMSKEAIVMASPGKMTNEIEINSTLSRSMLACILINSCYNNTEWKIAMPPNESIKCICVSKTLIGCMTSRRFLRIYGLAGTQKEIICFNYLPICMRAHENAIFICYSTDIKSTFINYSLFNIDADKKINEKQEAEHGILSLSEDAKLEWIGFSDEGNTFYSDSNGYLYTKCVTISKCGVWMPYSDLKFMLKHKLDNYWIIGISESNQTIKSILCHAANYPETLPRPTVSIISINMPLCEPYTEKSKLERDYWKNKITFLNLSNYDCSTQNLNLNLDQNELNEIVNKYEDSSKEVLMKLFMFSCKNNSEQRAYEVASIMDSASLKLAIKYGTKTRALVLTQNLIFLAEKRAIIEYNQESKQKEGNTKINISY
jgi:chromosome transmission fidelity protein 4